MVEGVHKTRSKNQRQEHRVDFILENLYEQAGCVASVAILPSCRSHDWFWGNVICSVQCQWFGVRKHCPMQNTHGKQKVKVFLEHLGTSRFRIYTNLRTATEVGVHLTLVVVGIVLIFLLHLFLQCWKHKARANNKPTNTSLLDSW